MKPNKKNIIREMVIDSISLRTLTKQAYHCRYVNSRSKHKISHGVAFEVLCILIRNHNNTIGIVAELRAASSMSRGSRQELFIFSSTVKSTLDLEPKFTPVQWVKGSLTPGLKRPGSEAIHVTSPTAEFKNAWRRNYTTSCTFWRA